MFYLFTLSVHTCNPSYKRNHRDPKLWRILISGHCTNNVTKIEKRLPNGTKTHWKCLLLFANEDVMLIKGFGNRYETFFVKNYSRSQFLAVNFNVLDCILITWKDFLMQCSSIEVSPKLKKNCNIYVSLRVFECYCKIKFFYLFRFRYPGIFFIQSVPIT